MKRRSHKSVPTQIGSPTPPPSVLLEESDAGDRVREWELPTSASKKPSQNVLASFAFLGIISLAGIALWYLLDSVPPTVREAARVPSAQSPSATPREVDVLPNALPSAAAKPEPTKDAMPNLRTVSRLRAPDVDGRWALSEFPTSGERVEIDPSGAFVYARSFTDACIRPVEGSKMQVGVRGRESSVISRTFVGDGEACAVIFDEPMFEVRLASGELRAVQLGLQQGAPFVAVKRIKNPTIPLQAITR